MTLVGPRPDLVEQAAHYTEEERRRLCVRPGLTGWSQVHGREEITWPERFGLDAWYVDHWSLGLDLRILVLTVGQLVRPEPTPVVDTLNIERARGEETRELARGRRGGAPWDGLLEELGVADVYLRRDFVETSCARRPRAARVPDRGEDVLRGIGVTSREAGTT